MRPIASRIVFAASTAAILTPALLAQDAAVSTAAAGAADAITEKPKGWETSLGLNLGLAGGNSDNFTVGGLFDTKKTWGKHIFQANAYGNYGEATTQEVQNGQLIETETTNVNNFGGFLQYNYLITDRWYVAGRLEGRHDEIAGVDYRIPVTANIGYYVIKKENMFLTVEAGPGYVWEQLAGSPADDYATLRFAENFEWKFGGKTRLFQSFEYLPEIADFGNYVINGTLGIETDIAKGLALQVVFKDFYRSEPAIWAGTNPPVSRQNNDYQLLAGIIYRFQ